MQRNTNFNSIKVRLERVYPWASNRMCLADFNSIKVRLELNLPLTHAGDLPYFNSIKVRLERYSAAGNPASVEHFNSIKVRLERLDGHTIGYACIISIP